MGTIYTVEGTIHRGSKVKGAEACSSHIASQSGHITFTIKTRKWWMHVAAQRPSPLHSPGSQPGISAAHSRQRSHLSQESQDQPPQRCYETHTQRDFRH